MAAALLHRSFTNGFFDVCGEPGGATLCLKTTCCNCLTLGDIHEEVNGMGGWWLACVAPPLLGVIPKVGAVLSCATCICINYNARTETARLAAIEESTGETCAKVICCHCCSAIQVHNEQKGMVFQGAKKVDEGKKIVQEKME